MILYHGTNNNNSIKILSHGFDLNKCGFGFGTTFGNGLYLSSDINIAKCYGEIILKILINNDIKLYKIKAYSPTSKYGRRRIKKYVKDKIINGEYDGFFANNKEEIVIFNLNLILSIDKID